MWGMFDHHKFLHCTSKHGIRKITFYRFSFPGTMIPGVSRNTYNSM